MLKLFTFVQTAAYSLRDREEGQTMAEYGVVLAVITLAVIGAITLLSDNVRAAIENVAGILPGQVEHAVRSVPGVTSAKVELTFDPPWSKDRMSEAAKLQLGML